VQFIAYPTGRRVFNKGDNLLDIDSIVTAKLSAIQTRHVESVCCLLPFGFGTNSWSSDRNFTLEFTST
jgi:hypothetical protein